MTAFRLTGGSCGWGCAVFSARPANALHATVRHCCRPHRSARGLRIVSAALQDEVLRSMADNGEVSVLVVRGNNLVQEACTRHGTAPTASAALGRALLGTLLMACFKAEGETTQVTFRGEGVLGGIQAIANALGEVKGKVGNAKADPPLLENGKLNVGRAVGKGVLAVVRSHPEWERPYTGMVEILSGEVAEDLAKYLVDSEQTNSALGLGVSINRDASVRAAGGFLVQVLPYASEETLMRLEENLRRIPSVTQMLHDGMMPRDMTDRILTGLGSGIQGFSLQPRYGPCEASALRERMRRAVALLGKDDVQQLLEEEGKIEVTCEFCKETYQFEEKDVLQTLELAETVQPKKQLLFKS